MAESNTFNLSRELVKGWSPCADGYRWFLGKFPQGGAYTVVHAALRADNRFADADWLFSNALAHALRNAPGATADLVAANSDETAKLIEATAPAKLKIPDATNAKAAVENDNGEDDARIGSSGNDAQIGSSGYGAQIGSSGNDARIGSSGNGARIGSSGNDAQIGSSGHGAQINAAGENAVVACAGLRTRAKAGANGALALAYWDEAAERARFAVGYVGEGIKADTWYEVTEQGELQEVAE